MGGKAGRQRQVTSLGCLPGPWTASTAMSGASGTWSRLRVHECLHYGAGAGPAIYTLLRSSGQRCVTRQNMSTVSCHVAGMPGIHIDIKHDLGTGGDKGFSE